MEIYNSVLKNDEKAIFALRALYRKFGYRQYKMSKFEAYDLYVRNKDFLVSDNIITFTDNGGKLMALKPDVTLSIIKNSSDEKGCTEKVYYNENVYRAAKEGGSYKEIMQMGLECLGQMDDYSIYEVLQLAAESLRFISEEFVLDISHMGIVSAILEDMGASYAVKAALLKCIGEKNEHELVEICKRENLDPARLRALVSTYGRPEEVLPIVKELCALDNEANIKSLERVVLALEKQGYGDKIRIDFSVINDMNYYNGFVFRGFIKGLASGILSGGQYDALMAKMGKKSGAIGFAIYLDMLEQLPTEEAEYDVDAVLLYDKDADPKTLGDAVRLLTEGGRSVLAQISVPEKIKYRQLLKLQERGVEIIENHA